jgi:hypothetical protein
MLYFKILLVRVSLLLNQIRNVDGVEGSKLFTFNSTLLNGYPICKVLNERSRIVLLSPKGVVNGVVVVVALVVFMVVLKRCPIFL